MKRFVIYNRDGKILRVGTCPNRDLKLQAGKDEFVMEGIANDEVQKIANGEIVDKTIGEIEIDKPIFVPFEKQPARITNEQWQNILDRLTKLEKVGA